MSLTLTDMRNPKSERISRYNRSGPRGAGNTGSGLTRSLDYGKEGLVPHSTQLLPARISSRIRIDQDSDCWIWTGYLHSQTGYPYSSLDGKGQLAYRVTYQLLVGPIPDGLELDHLCNTPECVNPDHLEPVTHAENMRRIRDRQMSCRKAGHDWTNPKNVRTRANGARYCAECERIYLRKRYADGYRGAKWL